MTDTLQGAVVGTTLMSLVGKKGGKKSGGSSGGGDGSNKFTDKDMTTPTSNPKNVRQGGGAGNSGNGAPGSGGSNSGTSRRGGSRHTGGVGHKAGRIAKGVAKAELKLGGIAAGAMLGLGATGSPDRGMIQGGMLSGTKVSKVVDNVSRNGQRRRLARAYNDYADEVAKQNSRFTPEEVNEQVRQRALDLINGNIQGPLSDQDKALKEALKDLEKTYAKDGLSEKEIKEQLSKDFAGIESGTISETSAPMRFVGNIKDKVTPAKMASGKRKWGFNGGAGRSNQRGSSSGGAGRSTQGRGNPSGGTGRSGQRRSTGGSGRSGRNT